jgi:endonuclease YncB( thermonuclease family)
VPLHSLAKENTKPHTITLTRWRERVRDSAGEGQRWFIFLNFKQFITALATAWLLVLLMVACSLPVFAAEITYFYDGDTVKIKDETYEYKLRITDIDAPERNQTYGKKSRRALMDFCKEANIYVAISGYDKYDRKLGKLLCNQQDVSKHMVKYGHAWFNKRYSMDYSLALLQDEARKNKLGLWQAQQQTPPWVWRKNHQH